MIRLRESDKTIFIITHDPGLVVCCCDYYMFFENGKVKWHGGMNEENLKLIEIFFTKQVNAYKNIFADCIPVKFFCRQFLL